MSKFIIIGSGRRVQQDIIPALMFNNFRVDDISIYAKRKKIILIRDISFNVKELVNLTSIIDSATVYVAIPHDFVTLILEKIYKINSKVRVIIDTPVTTKNLTHQFKTKKISIAEDAFTFGKFLINKKNKIKRFNVLIFYKSAFSYHGIAFIESIISEIKFGFTFFGIYFAFCKKGIAFIVGKRHYEKGYIYFNFKRIQFPELSKDEINLVGGLTDFDSISYRFLELKRIGLATIINDFHANNKIHVTVQSAYSHFKKSRFVEKYTISKFFKKLLRYLIRI